MPEAPDLEVIRDYLNHHAAGLTVSSAKVVRPTVVRSLVGEFPQDLCSRTLEGFQRRGKFILARFSGDRLLAVNPMLTGGFQYCPSSAPLYKRVCFTLSLSNSHDIALSGPTSDGQGLPPGRTTLWPRCQVWLSRGQTCWTPARLPSLRNI